MKTIPWKKKFWQFAVSLLKKVARNPDENTFKQDSAEIVDRRRRWDIHGHEDQREYRKNPGWRDREMQTGFYDEIKKRINKDASEECRYCRKKADYCKDQKQIRASNEHMTRFMRYNTCEKAWSDWFIQFMCLNIYVITSIWCL